MNTSFSSLHNGQPNASRRWPRMILYSLLLLAVPLALPSGMVFAAVGAWWAVKSGTVIFLPAGAVLLLAGLAILHRRSIADLVVLALATLATTAWWIAGSDSGSWVLRSLVELSSRSELMLGLLVIMLATLLFVRWHRLFSAPAERTPLAAAYVR